jgi:hypothetical protein
MDSNLGPARRTHRGLEVDHRIEDLAERARAAYSWIVDNAIFCPDHDIVFEPCTVAHPTDPQHTLDERARIAIRLPGPECYSSSVLLPILTLLTARRMLIVGAPGRGKTTVAVLMGLLAGYGMEEMRTAVQRGHHHAL